MLFDFMRKCICIRIAMPLTTEFPCLKLVVVWMDIRMKGCMEMAYHFGNRKAMEVDFVIGCSYRNCNINIAL